MRFGINPTIQTTGRPTDMAITAHDIVSDSPTNNFCTLNPLRAGTQNLADGNLKISAKSENHWGTLAVDPADTNKYYFEMLVIAQKAGAQVVGVSNQSGTATNYLGSDANGWGIFFQSNSNNGDLVNSTLSSSGVTFSNGDIVQVCFTASKIWFGKNGTFIGNPDTETSPSFSNLSGTLSPVISNRSDLGGSACINFGQDHLFGGSTFSTAATNAGAGSNTPDNGIGTFAFSPPTGALALCTANLPDPAIDPALDDVPEDYFKALKYIGNDTTNTSVPAVGFKPDFIWVKNRSSAAGHALTNSVQGFDKLLISNGTNSEISTTAFSVSSNGFSVSGGDGKINASGFNYVAWCWKAGGSPSATDDGTGVSGSAKLVDTSGTASSTTCKSFKDAAVTAGASNVKCPSKMSINQKAGFSIVKYVGDGSTGSTVPHGLSQAPQMIIVKPLNGTTTYGWRIYTEMTGNTKYLNLDNTDPANTYTDWNNTSPTSSVFTVNSSSAQTNNESGTDYIAYCWHSVAGYSAFGSYTGNGSADGPFIYTGFKPAWVMVKATNLTGSSWFVWDNQRSPHNEMVNALLPNDSLQELTDREIDFLSNGFKPRANDGNYNQNYTYIYAAFAEQPFKYATAR